MIYLMLGTAITAFDLAERELSRHQAKVNYIKETYNEKSEKYASDMRAEQEKYNRNLQRIREDGSRAVHAGAYVVSKLLDKKVQSIDQDALIFLNNLKDANLGKHELQALVDRYGAKTSQGQLWNMKILSDMARKNGYPEICPDFNIEDSYKQLDAIVSEIDRLVSVAGEKTSGSDEIAVAKITLSDIGHYKELFEGFSSPAICCDDTKEGFRQYMKDIRRENDKAGAEGLKECGLLNYMPEYVDETYGDLTLDLKMTIQQVAD